MTWQAAQIIQLLLRPINTKLSALISALLHNEVMSSHTEVEMTQLDRVLFSRFGICVDRFRWSFRWPTCYCLMGFKYKCNTMTVIVQLTTQLLILDLKALWLLLAFRAFISSVMKNTDGFCK